MENTLQKLYAAYCSGLVELDSVKACFPLVENALRSSNVDGFTPESIRPILEEELGESFPIDVLRQVLSYGLRAQRLKKRKEKYFFAYNVDVQEQEQHLFESKLDGLVDAYAKFCRQKGFRVESKVVLKERIISSLNAIDAEILSKSNPLNAYSSGKIDYSLFKFIEECSKSDADTFTFISALCLSNLRVEALLYAPTGAVHLNDLHIYLDTPIIYSLYGLSDPASNESYARIVEDLLKSGCKVQILDRNREEFEESLHSTIEWTYGSQFSFVAASMSARAIRARWQTKAECEAGILRLRRSLYERGISERATSYDRAEDQYQIDEEALRHRIGALYRPSKENDHSRDKKINTDVTALSMIYRLRRGGVAYRIENARHIMLTSNAALAKASKLYDRALRVSMRQARAIPVCVHSDLMASLLWVINSEALRKYKKDRILSLCYEGTLPDDEMSARFVKILDEELSERRINEEVYIFMKCGAVVENALMQVTNGKMCFGAEIVKRIMDAISEDERKKFEQERSAFSAQIRAKENDVKELKDKLLKISENEKSRQLQRDADFIKLAKSVSYLITALLILVMSLVVGFLIGCFIHVEKKMILMLVMALTAVELLRMGSAWSLPGFVRRRIQRKLEAIRNG